MLIYLLMEALHPMSYRAIARHLDFKNLTLS